MRRSLHLAAVGALALGVVGIIPAVTPAASADAGTVTISGNAYEFIFSFPGIGSYNDTLPGKTDGSGAATITVDGHPEIAPVTTGYDGAYSITVPNDTDITLHATASGFRETYTQTFHTSGADLTQVNFQMPAEGIFKAMAGIAGAKLDADGNLAQCAIVSTVFQKEGRDFATFDEFHEFHPHGVADVSASDAGSVKPTYFNKSVIPSKDQAASSRDGGVVWTGVPEGRYQITAAKQDGSQRFSTFVADCKDGRFINASPPLGLFELKDGESVNPAYVATPAMASGRIEFPPPPAPPVTAPVMVATTTTVTAPKKVKAKHRATIGVQVKAAGTAKPTGTVALYRGAKKIATLTLKAGKAAAKIRFAKPGKQRLEAVYAGSATAAASTSKVVTVRVR